MCCNVSRYVISTYQINLFLLDFSPNVHILGLIKKSISMENIPHSVDIFISGKASSISTYSAFLCERTLQSS